MKLIIVLLGALVASALGDDAPGSFNMPNLDMLSGLTGGQMPQLPPGMNLDDLKDAFDNMPPAMKDRLNDMAGSFGMKLDDVKEALNNPPDQLKQLFENNAQRSDDATPIGAAPAMDIGSLLKNVDMGAIGGMMQGMDIGSMMQGVDMGMVGDLLKNVDIGSMMQGANMGMVGDLLKNVDMGSMMQGLDMGMVGGMMQNMDLGAISGLMQNIDMGAITGMMNNLDFGTIRNMMSGIDIGAVGQMARNFDIGSIGQLVSGKMPRSLEDVKRMMGVPEGASMEDMRTQLKQKLETMGVPIEDPKAMLEFTAGKLRALNIPLPEGLDLNDMMGSVHRQMAAMGLPTEPEKLKDFVMGHFGLEGTKLEDLMNPGAMANILKKKVYGMLGLNENEDLTTIKDRMTDQLFEEIQKHGANVNKDSTSEEFKEEIDRLVNKEVDSIKEGLEKSISSELEHMGIQVETLSPHGIHDAVKNKLSGLGFPVDDPQAFKSHVMKMLKKEIMSKVMPMIMHCFMPRRQQPQMPHMMRPQQQMPHMMGPQQQMPHMMGPQQQMPYMMGPQQQMIPLNLDIEVNVQQPEQAGHPFMPRYLHGAEMALDHPIEYMDDREVFDHIMTVRQALMSGEMSEDVIQEMLEDLMEARLKIRVLSVKNMFLRDRLAAQGQPRRGPVPFLPRQPARQTPTLLRALRGDRVL